LPDYSGGILTDDDQADEQRRDLVAQTIAGFIVGSAALVHPEAGLAASTAGPSVALAVNRLIKILSERRAAHAEQTLNDAARAADLPVEQFVDRALADEKRTELLVRALTAAQDTSLREKRRALGRALAAGVGDESKVDDEFLFIRAVADLDEPHIVTLQVISTVPPFHHPLPRGWLYTDLCERLPGLVNALPAILATLELHTLIGNTPLSNETGREIDVYTIAQPGRVTLSRLADEAT
jgi:hypothetical protein